MKNKFFWVVLGIFVLALLLRIINLGNIPYGFHVDEAKAAWNAFSILKTGKDDKGNFLPLYYDSFGDFRPTGIIYSIIPMIVIFGNTIFATRFSSAFFGTLSIFPLILIFKQLDKKYKKFWWIPGLLLAINPWHIMMSRATSEGIMTIFFTLFAIYFFQKTILEKKKKKIFSFLTLFFLTIAYFFYHNIRVLAPFFLIITAIFYWQKIKENKNIKRVLMVILGSLLITFLFFSNKEAKGRMNQVSILSDPKIRLETINMPNEEGSGHVLEARIFHNRPFVVLRMVADEYLNYFSPNFLTDDSALPLRYRTQKFGLITYVEFLLLAFSLCMAGVKKEVWLVILFLLVSPIPAAATNEDIPNLSRALFMTPFMVLLETYGVIFLFSIKKHTKILVGLLSLALFFNFIYFCHSYFVHEKFGMIPYKRDSGKQEIVTKIYGLREKYSKIMVANSIDNLSYWFGFLNKIDPKKFNEIIKNKGTNWNWENIEFIGNNCPTKGLVNSSELKNKKNILIVDSEGCKTTADKKLNLIDVIKRPDLSEPYTLWEMK